MNNDNINIDTTINDATNNGITDRDDVHIRCWGVGRDTVYLTIDGEEYALSKTGLRGPGTPNSVKAAFNKDGQHGAEVLQNLRETATSPTFSRWRETLLEQINILEEMVAAE